MKAIFVLIMLLGCSKFYTKENKDKNYEDLDLTIHELLISAIYNRDLDLVNFYLRKLKYINSIIGKRGSLLHIATQVESKEIVNFLLSKGISTFIKNSKGEYASDLTDNSEIKDLINNYRKREELSIAIKNKEKDIIELLIKDINNTFFLKVNNKDIIEELCEQFNWSEDKNIIKIFLFELENLKQYSKVSYIRRKFLEKGLSDKRVDRETFNDHIEMLEKEKELDKKYEVSTKMEESYIRKAINLAYIPEFNRLCSIENKNRIFCALKFEFIENSDFISNFEKKYSYLNITHLLKSLRFQEKADKKEIDKILMLLNNMNINFKEEDHIKIEKLFPLFIDTESFKIQKGISDLYRYGTEDEIKNALIYYFGKKQLNKIELGNLLIYSIYKNYKEVVNFLINVKDLEIDKDFLEDYLLDKNLLNFIIQNNFLDKISKLPLENFKNKFNKDYNLEPFLNLYAKTKNFESAKVLIDLGIGINSKDRNGYTFLILASINGSKEIIELLLEKGADVNQKNNEGRTALMFASRNCNLEVLKLLIEKGAEINGKNSDGLTALMIASYNGHKEIAELLIEKGAGINDRSNDGSTSLTIASEYDHIETVKLLIEKGAAIDDKHNSGCTALMIASYNGHKEIVELLIEKGANINDKHNCGWTALMIASYNGHKEIVKILIEKGANIEEKNNRDCTALMIACYSNHYNIANLLRPKVVK